MNPGKVTYDNGASWTDNIGGYSWAFKLEGECDGGLTFSSPCDDKIVVECGVEYTADLIPNAGSWVNYTDVDYNYTGSEQVFEFTAPHSGAYLIDANQGTGDADFMIMDVCGNIGDNLIDFYWPGEDDHFINLEAGVTYYIIADLYETSAATTVSLTINCPDGGEIFEPDFDCFQGDGIVAELDEALNLDPQNPLTLIADDFIVEEGTQFTLRQITIDTNQVQSPDHAIFNIRENANGKPGEVLQTIELVPTSSVAYSVSYNEPVYHMVFDLVEPLTFTAGTYWLQPKMTTPQPSTVWWGATYNGNNGAFVELSENDGTTWQTIENLNAVFFVAGDCEELGVNDLNSNDFVYYPNPVNSVLNINSQKEIQSIEVFNLAGQKVLSNKSVQNGKLNLESLTFGTYVFKVTLEGGQLETFKIIKK